MNNKGGWLNLEKGVTLVLALLLAWLGVDYFTNLPAPLELSPATGEMPAAPKPPLTRAADAELGAGLVRIDPFVPPELAMEKVEPLGDKSGPAVATPATPGKPGADKPKDGAAPGAETVKLPRKPDPQAARREAAEEAAQKKEEEEFPLLVVGFVKLESGKGARRVLAAPRTDPGRYLSLGKGDEYRSADGSYKLVLVTDTKAVFQREDGRTVTINKDPLLAWKPLLRDEQAEAAAAAAADEVEEAPEDPDTREKRLQAAEELRRQAAEEENKLKTLPGLRDATADKGVRPYGANARKEETEKRTRIGTENSRIDIHGPAGRVTQTDAQKLSNLLDQLKNQQTNLLEDIF